MPSIDINIRTNLKDIQKSLNSFAYKQMPFATAQTLTQLAKEVQAAEQENLKKTFDNPTPFTVNSVGVKAATKTSLTAIVYVKDIAAAYLEPYEVGGVHKLNSKALLNPKDISLNQYGNLPKGKLRALKGRKDVFIGQIKTKNGETIGGVWQRPARIVASKNGKVRKLPKMANATGHLKLLIRFGDALPVKQHLDYRQRAQQLVNRRFNAVFGAMLAKAMATAK